MFSLLGKPIHNCLRCLVRSSIGWEGSIQSYDRPSDTEAPRSCYSCTHMISDSSSLKHFISDQGVEILQSSEAFHQSVEYGCRICSLKQQWAFRTWLDFHNRDPFPNNMLGKIVSKRVRFYSFSETSLNIQRATITIWSRIHQRNCTFRFFVEAVNGKPYAKGLYRGARTYDANISTDDPAARFITTRPVNLRVGEQKSFKIAQSWLQDCLENHISCSRSQTLALPTRLLEIRGNDIRSLEAYLRCPSQGEKISYATLSYRWGGFQPFVLNANTMKDIQNNMELEALPKTVQDALIVCWNPDIRFIWIDALCI